MYQRILAPLLTLTVLSHSLLAFQKPSSKVIRGAERHDGHETYVRVGPFTPDMVESSENVWLDSTGEISLVDEAGRYPHMGTVTLNPVELVQPVNYLQVGLAAGQPQDTDLRCFIRFQYDDNREFSAWRRVGTEGEILLERPINAFQVHLVLLSTTGRDTPRLRAVTATPETVNTPPSPPTSDVLAAPEPDMISRAAWGARQPKESYTAHTPRELVVHHSSSPDLSGYHGASTVRGIQDFHMNGRGWIDIGYHFLIGPDGKIFQGRPTTVVGAHAPPNVDKVGICVIGNFAENADPIPENSMNTLYKLLTYLCGKYGIGVGAIYGHRDFRQTDCPGDVMYRKLPEIRAEVKRRLDALSR